MEDPVSDGLDRLLDAMYLVGLEDGGRDESFDRMHARLLEHHRSRGTRQTDLTAAWQARAGWLVSEGYSEAEVALRVGVSLRSVQALVALLRTLYSVVVEESAQCREAA